MNVEVLLGSRSFRGLSVKEINNLLSRAYEIGICRIDSAPTYGEVEKNIGRATRGKLNNKFKVCTKIMRYGDSHSAKNVNKSINKRLRNLKVEQIEIVYLHGTKFESIPEKTLQTLDKLLEKNGGGMVKNLGFAGDNLELVDAISANFFSHFLTTLNIVDQNNINVIKANTDKVFTLKRILANHFWDRPDVNYAEKNEAARRYEINDKVAIYQERSVSLKLEDEIFYAKQMRETFIRFAAYAHGVKGIVIGSSNFDHLNECISDLEKGPLPGDLFAKLEKIWRERSSNEWETIS